MNLPSQPFHAIFTEIDQIKTIVNQGVDSHLEAFTSSSFDLVVYVKGEIISPLDYDPKVHGVAFSKIRAIIDPNEMKIFLRRLINLGGKENLLLAQDCFASWICDDANSECAEELDVESWLSEIYCNDGGNPE